MALAPVNQAIDFALDTTGMYQGLCDHFVGLAFGQAHSGFESAKVHWTQTPEKYRHAGDTDAPVGSLVFFNGGKYGHVAIVTGKDKSGNPIITTTHTQGGKPVEMPLSQAMGLGYSGWANPYFGGQVAKLRGVDLNRAVSNVAADPQGAAQEAGSTTNLVLDTITPREAAETEGLTWEFVKSHPEIRDVFELAVEEDWFNSGQIGKDRFTNAIQGTTWARNNGAYATKYLLEKAKATRDGKTSEAWNERVRTTAELVQQVALKIGATLDDAQLKFFADQTMINGWDAPGREAMLSQALSGSLTWQDAGGKTHAFTTDFINYDAGGPAATIAALKNVAMKNGLTYSEEFYKSEAKSILNLRGSLDNSIALIRKQAATQNPVFADKIASGQDMEALASPYTSRMASILELDPASIKLDDPWIKQAMGQVDDKGNPSAMGLWDFEKALMKDDRYQYTKAAHAKVSSIVGKIGSMMGFGGSY